MPAGGGDDAVHGQVEPRRPDAQHREDDQAEHDRPEDVELADAEEPGQRGVQRLESLGFQVRYREDLFSRQRYLAGSDPRRYGELKEFLLAPDVKAIFAARGGYGSMRLLPQLEGLQPPSPKILMGYSDITSLLNFAWQRWGWITFHGPVVAKDIGDRLAEAGERGFVGLKGHRSVGGCRASLYNALPQDAADALATFMDDFRRRPR